MEELGTWQVEILHVDGGTQKMFRADDRLARKGLPHPAVCPLCDQVEETLDHLLVYWSLVSSSVLVQLVAGPWTASTCPRIG